MSPDSGYPVGARFDSRAPFNRPSLDAADVHKIDDRATELAVEAFDKLDQRADEWLRDQRDSEDWIALNFAAITHNIHPLDPDAYMAVERAVQRLRDAFVQENAICYRDAAEDQITEGSEA